jgi:hypothetical protein
LHTIHFSPTKATTRDAQSLAGLLACDSSRFNSNRVWE